MSVKTKQLASLLVVLLAGVVANAQLISGAVDVVTVYSQNGQFYLKSIPYDDESPSLRGKALVYRRGSAKPLYTLNRGFDLIEPNTLFLSNDGEVIFHANSWEPNEEKDGLKSITVYKHGQLIRSLTETEVTGCNKQKERCRLVYYNDNKPAVDEKERFLKQFAIFSFADFVYLTDSKKITHTFDLKDGSLIRSEPFADIFDQIKTKGRLTRVTQVSYDAPYLNDFPRLKNGRNTNVALAHYLDMKASGGDDRQYKLYTVILNGNLLRDGTLEIENIEVDKELPKDRIVEFFRTHKFDRRSIPAVFEEWNFRDEFFYFRNKNALQARRERQQELTAERQEYQRRLTLETIDGVYIPANLLECFVELDKRLSEIDKKEMLALPERNDMISYHLSLGMWIRNNWGLWGGSRLQKYFMDRGISHPDNMSGIVLVHYHDWLHGNKDSWKTWESQTKKNQARE